MHLSGSVSSVKLCTGVSGITWLLIRFCVEESESISSKSYVDVF